MKTKSPFVVCLALLLSAVIVVPGDILAEPQGAAQRAGQVDRLIPAVNIARGSKTMNAVAKTVVDWQDVVNTQANARVRVALDDGSVLNVGSDSSVKVVKHDAGAQQTELELTYGKLRTQAQKIAKPDGKFEVRTAAGVAGVVGTDFYVAYANNVMTVIVYEGLVRVCNLAGACIVIKAGQMGSVRSGDNSAPAPPTQAPLDMLVAAATDTAVSGQTGGAEQAYHVTKGTGITLGIIAVIPIAVFAVVGTHHSRTPVSTTPTTPTGCNPATNPTACG
jgi:hypothetical protein